MSIKRLTEQQLRMASECLKTIAHPKRLDILDLLERQILCVSEIMEATETAQSVISDHLRLMEAKGILTSERKGRKVYYQLAIPQIKTILDCIRNNTLKREHY